MARIERRLAAMERNPLRWRYSEVAGVLRAFGFVLQSKSGSHRIWARQGVLPVTLVEKGHGAVPAYQVKQAVVRIRSILEDE